LQFKNVEIHQPVDLPLVETMKFNNADLNLNVIFNQEDVEVIVMTISIVLETLAILLLENANTSLNTTDVTITINVPLINVLLKDAHTPKRIALITMHVPETFVMLLPETVLQHLLLANLLIVKLQNVILKLVVKLPIEIVMMVLHVLLMFAVKIVDVTILLIINCVMIMIHALLTNVLSRKDVSTRKSHVTITTHVPMMFV